MAYKSSMIGLPPNRNEGRCNQSKYMIRVATGKLRYACLIVRFPVLILWENNGPGVEYLTIYLRTMLYVSCPLGRYSLGACSRWPCWMIQNLLRLGVDLSCRVSRTNLIAINPRIGLYWAELVWAACIRFWSIAHARQRIVVCTRAGGFKRSTGVCKQIKWCCASINSSMSVRVRQAVDIKVLSMK